MLTDPEKRRIYDQVGEEGLKGGAGGTGGYQQNRGSGNSNRGSGFAGSDPFEIFRNMFSGGSSDSSSSSGGFPRRGGDGGSSNFEFNFNGFPGSSGAGGFQQQQQQPQRKKSRASNSNSGFGGGGGFENMFGGFGGQQQQQSQRMKQSPPLYQQHNDLIQEFTTTTYPKQQSTSTSFSKKPSRTIWLVHFYTQSTEIRDPWIDKYVKLCQSLKSQGIKCGAIDCELQQTLCKQKDLQEQYPAFLLITNTKEFKYSDSEESTATTTATPSSIHKFIMSSLSSSSSISNVINIRTMNQLDEFIEKTCKNKKIASKNIGIILMTSKFDTSLLMKTLAYYQQGMVVIGEIRGKNEKLIKAFELDNPLEKLPIMIIICGGEDKLAYEVLYYYKHNILHYYKHCIFRIVIL